MSDTGAHHPTCYVSMPFGRKKLPDGQELDFDSVYVEGIRPALEAAGLIPTRADALVTRGSIMKAVLEKIFYSEFMIADVTNANANVLYELGVRHAIKPRTTIIITASNEMMPFDISHLQYISYKIHESRIYDAGMLRDRLIYVLQQRFNEKHVDSPIYEYFPDFATTATLSAEVLLSNIERRPSEILREQLLEARSLPIVDAIAKLRNLESNIISNDLNDSSLVTDLLLAYRDCGSWSDVINFYDSLPLSTRRLPMLVQQTAMALNRRNDANDRQRAILMLQQLISEKGHEPESCGILGRIYKDQYQETQDISDLDAAIKAYRDGYLANPSDYYTGVNLLTMLSLKNDSASQKEFNSRLVELRNFLENRALSGRIDYWEIATRLELAALAGDWAMAEKLLPEVMARAPAPWMIATTARQLDLWFRRISDPADHSRLKNIVNELLNRSLVGGRP